GLGIVPGTLDRFASAASSALDARADPAHLLLWHGVNTPLVLSAVTIALGIVVFVARRPLARVLALGDGVPSSREGYLGVLRGLNWSANRITGVVQNGSLPIYTGVILFTAAALPLAVFAGQAEWPGWPELAAEPGHVVVSAVIVGSAL